MKIYSVVCFGDREIVVDPTVICPVYNSCDKLIFNDFESKNLISMTSMDLECMFIENLKASR